MQLIEVKSKADKRRFQRLPLLLYAHDPNFILPLYADVERLFHPDHQVLFRQGAKAKRWLLVEDKNKVLGRIAAFAGHAGDMGGIGFFECVNNPEAAHILFSAAEQYLKDLGLHSVQAPVNFGPRTDFWGLLLKGYAKVSPSYKEPYHLPYYEQFFENEGYTPGFDQITSSLHIKDAKTEILEHMVKRLLHQHPSLHIKHYDRNNHRKYVLDFVRVYNEAWADKDFFVPVNEALITEEFKKMQAILRPDFLYFAYDADRPVGVYLSIPEINPIINKLNGSLNLWGKIRFLWYRNRNLITRSKGLVFGVIPEYKRTGLPALLAMAHAKVLQNELHIKETELSWIGDFNEDMKGLLNRLGATTSKIHRTYKKNLTQKAIL